MANMGDTASVDGQNHQPSNAELASQVNKGAAIFSTGNGILEPEIADRDTTCVVVRGDPDDGCFAIAENIRKNFPEECKKIFPTNQRIFDYFDHRDIHIHGMDVLLKVLDIIASENRSRALFMFHFTKAWVAANPEKHQAVIQGGDLSLFTPAEIEEHSKDFLEEALYCMRCSDEYGLPPSQPSKYSHK